MRTLITNLIEERICEAIEMIVDNAVASAGYDKTIRAQIVECIDQSIGKYKIKYQDNLFFAYSENINTTYSKGTEVYVLIHNNDLNMNKTILGTVKKLGSDYIDVISTKNRYEKIGTNFISKNNNFELCSFISEDRQDITNDLTFIHENEINEYIKQSSYFILEADIKTNLPKTQRYKGNYGITFEADFYASELEKEEEKPEIITKTYKLDINNLAGEPYGLNDWTPQFAVFEMTPNTFIGIKNFSIFEYGFPEQKDNQPTDIFIKNISLYSAIAISESELSNCYLSISTIEGTYFDELNLETDTKSMKAQIIVKGNAIDDSIQQPKYYWFREDMKVSSVDLEKFHKYGGAGWECLNHYNIINSVENGIPDAIEWLPAENTYTVSKQDILSTEQKYKCVALYGEVLLSREITFKNTDAPYKLEIISDDGFEFFEGDGEPTLTCIVNNESNTKDYIYYWVTLDKYNLLSEYPDAKQNIIEKIKIRTIEDFITYKCAVYSVVTGNYIGIATAKITNGKKDSSYNLVLNNGIQVFKYDENGISPTSEVVDNPQTITPLDFILYDKKGNAVDTEKLKAKGIIKWIIPFEEDSLLKIILDKENPPSNVVKDEVNRQFIYEGILSLAYTIADRYIASKQNNIIKLVIEYDNFVLNRETSFSFIKEGDPGTNGTNYYCKILPNVNKEDIFNDYPMYIVNTQTKTNYLNYYRPSGQENQWFKVQLWENEQLLFEDTANTVYSDAKPYIIKWSLLKNKYTSNVSDSSNFNYDEASNTWSYIGAVDGGKGKYVNIIQCQVTYDNKVFYATLPLLYAVTYQGIHDFTIKPNTGYNFVRYASDGTQPKYNGTSLFEGALHDSSLKDITASPDLSYLWKITGTVYRNGEWSEVENLKISASNNETLPSWQCDVRPASKYNGECLSNRLECIIQQNGTTLVEFAMPIHMYLNRYGLAALNDWNGNSIEINKDGGYILSPQIGAGSKDANNNFTGIVMGQVKSSDKSEIETGLLGYTKGVRSIFLDAETGIAEFGTSSKVIIDPTENRAILKSGNYNGFYNDADIPDEQKKGMQIDLENSVIDFGSGNFHINAAGHLTAKGGGSIAGWKIQDEVLTGDQVGMRSTYKDTKEIALWAGSSESNNNNARFKVNFKGQLTAREVDIGGTIQADDGYIGGWSIDSGKLIAEEGKNAAIIMDNFQVKGTGELTAKKGIIGGWLISNGELISADGTVVLESYESDSKIITNNIQMQKAIAQTDSEGEIIGYTYDPIGTINLVHGSIKDYETGEESPTDHLGISSALGHGIILEAQTNMALRSKGSIYLATTDGDVYINGKLAGVARFG